MEAIILHQIYTFDRPSKQMRKKIDEFAKDYNLSRSSALNKILNHYFMVYEHGLKEHIRAAYQKKNPTFEEWKAEQDRKFEEDLRKMNEHKHIVKPRKKHPEE